MAQITAWKASNLAREAFALYRDRVRVADAELDRVQHDMRVSTFGKREASEKRQQVVDMAERTLKASLAQQRSALEATEKERGRIEVLDATRLRLLDTLEHLSVEPEEYADLCRDAVKDGDFTMVRALLKRANADGITVEGIRMPSDNLKAFDGFCKAVDRYLVAENKGWAEDYISEVITKWLAETDPESAVEIRAYPTPETLEEGISADLLREMQNDRQATTEEGRAFVKGVLGDGDFANEQEVEAEARARAMVDISEAMKKQADEEKSSKGTGDGSGEGSGEDYGMEM